MGVSCLDVPPTLLAQLVMVSDLGDLRRAADALDCTPQLLSRSIGDLERATGSQLLVSEGATRILGAAGERVAEKARAALAAISRFQATAYEDRSTLKVAHVANADTLSVLIEQSSLSPPTRVSEHLVPDHQQLTQLRAYRLDVAVCTATPTIPDDLVAAPLRLDPLVVSRPTGGSQTGVVVPFYGLAWRAHDELTAAYTRRAARQVERVSVPLGSGREHAALIRAASGRPVVVANSAAQTLRDLPRVTAEDLCLRWWLVWRRDDTSPLVHEFVAAAQELARRHQWLEPAAVASRRSCKPSVRKP